MQRLDELRAEEWSTWNGHGVQVPEGPEGRREEDIGLTSSLVPCFLLTSSSFSSVSAYFGASWLRIGLLSAAMQDRLREPPGAPVGEELHEPLQLTCIVGPSLSLLVKRC